MASLAKKAKPAQKPCPYGAGCYRKNPAHLAEFSHPKAGDGGSQSTSDDKIRRKKASIDTSTLPPCKYGAKCYRKNLLHFAEFSHPMLPSVPADNDDSGDTDTYDSDDDKGKKTDPKSKDGKDGVVVARGMSLMKSFTKMTELERRDLIKKAFEEKERLEEELEATKKQVEEKDKELNQLQEKLSKGVLMVEGEKEALEKDKIVYFTLLPERHYKEGSADQTHFRLAESQFYRLLSNENDTGYRVSKVQYVVNPTMVKRFKAARQELKETRGEDMSYPVLGFHGTDDKNIIPICENGFKMPGDIGFKEKTDPGWYGAGIYFSEFPSYSMDYIQGATRLLLCQVLPGKVFDCNEINEGSEKQEGYDSHMSPDKKEIVIFNSHAILPSYIVHYSCQNSDFIYKAAPGMKRIRKVGGLDRHNGTLTTKINKAKKEAASKIFDGRHIMFEMAAKKKKPLLDLVKKHKGSEGTWAKYDMLVVAEDVNVDDNTAVNQALQDDKPVVTEDYVVECILHKDCLDPDYFLDELYD